MIDMRSGRAHDLIKICLPTLGMRWVMDAVDVAHALPVFPLFYPWTFLTPKASLVFSSSYTDPQIETRTNWTARDHGAAPTEPTIRLHRHRDLQKQRVCAE